jgi:periplasmic divalent cation tolerance protein
MTDKIVVLVTCANHAEAQHIARAQVQARLAACANILSSPVHSIYRWKGKVEKAAETLMLVKTSQKRFARLRERVRALHSYKVPEIIALPITEGLSAYLAWITGNLAAEAKPRARRHKRGKE